jgi:hypothetical protein
VIGAAIQNARRWGAIWFFRLASRLLERCGALLALGHRRKQQQIKQDFHRDHID